MKEPGEICAVREKRPYPYGDERALNFTWQLPPVEWINAVWRLDGEDSAPGRILVAGCGDGNEAFSISYKFPQSQIVGVDFSARSIAIAQELQKNNAGLQNIRFITADLADPQFPEIAGGDFDFISCHGVLSYIPSFKLVLENFARCLKSDGALYLGVNGSAHKSVSLRRALPLFGFEMGELVDDGPHLRDVLKMCDAVFRSDGFTHFRQAEQSSAYLASDVFASLILNRSLNEWNQSCREAGLHSLGSYSSLKAFRSVVNDGLHHLLMPKSQAEVSEFLDLLSPPTFHRLLFAKSPVVVPPWEKQQQLLEWRVVRTKLCEGTFLKPDQVSDRLRRFKIRSAPLNTLIDWRMPEWELAILGQADGRQSLLTVLNRIPLAVPAKDLREQLYLLYQLGLINLLPPANPR